MKFLKALVIGMGVLIIAGVIAVGYGLYRQVSGTAKTAEQPLASQPEQSAVTRAPFRTSASSKSAILTGGQPSALPLVTDQNGLFCSIWPLVSNSGQSGSRRASDHPPADCQNYRIFFERKQRHHASTQQPA